MSNVVILGIVSFFTDLSTEMVYPLIPLFLTTVLGATPAVVGVIEGLAESVASLLKVWSGYLGDKYKNKKALTFAGYSGAILYKGALLLAASWPAVLAARVLDRLGKGIRTAPRDALIAESSHKSKLGGAFGLHKMLDMLGSAAGIILSYFLIRNASSIDFKRVFLVSAIPAVLGVLMIFFVKEKRVPRNKAECPKISFKQLDKRLKAFLVIAFIFTLGNSSNAFLLLRAKSAGYDTNQVILLYFLFNFTASLFSYPLGRLSDRIGRRLLLVAGYFFYGMVYLGFAAMPSKNGMIVLFVLYGLYTALTSGAERALVCEISPPGLRGTMLGTHATLTGIALLPASVIAGVLWDVAGAAAPFYFGSGLAFACSAAIAVVLKNLKGGSYEDTCGC